MATIGKYAQMLKKAWYWLTEPALNMHNHVHWQQARLLASILVWLIPIPLLAGGALSASDRVPLLAGLTATVLLLGAYGLNRAGRYRDAAFAAVGSSSAFIWVIALSNVNLLLLLVAPVWLSSILLSVQATGVLIGLHVSAMLLLPLFAPSTARVPSFIAPSGFTLILSALVWFVAYYRELLDLDRGAELVEEEYLRAIIEDQTEFICRARPDGRLTFVNEPYCRYMGKTRDELLGQIFTMFVPEEERKALDAKLFACRPENPVVAYEHRVVLPNGELRYQHWTSRAVFDAAGALREFRAAGYDSTERKQMEVQLQQSKEDLERTLRVVDGKVTELKALHHIAASMSSRLEIKALLQFIVERARLLVDSSSCSVLLLDEGTEELVFDAAVDPIAGMRIPPNLGIAGRALRDRVPQVVHDVTTDKDHYTQIARHSNLPTRSLLAVPLFVRDKGIGVLNAINKHHGKFSAADCELLETMGIHAAIAIENARLYEQAQQEIIERKRAETALRDSHRFLQSALDALSASIAILDASGKIIAVNASWRDFADANRLRWADYGIGRNYLEVCASAFGAAADEAWSAASGIREVIMHQRKDFELEYPCHSPTKKRWFILHVNRFQGEGPVRVVVSHEDITARKRAEAALRESEEQFRQVLDNIPGVVWLNDPNMSITYYVSPTIQDIYGVTPAQEYEHPGAGMNMIHPDDRARVAPIIDLQKQGQATSVEYRVLPPDGAVRWVLERAYPIRDDTGAVHRVVAIAIDITARKKAEELLQKRTYDLNQRVKELRCIYSIYKLLEQRDVALETLLQNIVELIPIGWQYSDITCARILLGKQEYATSNFMETGWKLSSTIASGAEQLGQVEVYYLEEKPREEGESPFLKEEVDLLTAIAERVSEVIQRTRAEAALRESEQEHRSMIDEVIDNATVGIFILDANFRVIWVNKAIERFLSVRRAAIIGKDNRQLIREQFKDIFEEPEEFAQRVLATYADNTYIEYFQCHVLMAGKRMERWLEHLSQPIMTGLYTGGRIEFYTDVTARKEAEEALRVSEEKWRSLAENAPDTIFTVDRDGKITFINRVPAGRSIEDTLGTNVYDYVAPEYVDTVQRTLEAVFQTGAPAYYEISARGDYDKLSWYATRLAPIKHNDEVVAAILITSDITERKRTEELLQEREQKFRSVIEKSNDGIVLTDEQGIITEWNQAAERVFGLTQGEVLGKPIWDVQYELAGAETPKAISYNQIKDDYGKVYASGYAPWLDGLQETEVLRADGTRHSVQTSAFVIKTNRGFMVGSISRDITEQKRAEKDLEEERALLALRVYERTAELSKANAELARAARLKDEFLASMSHELRTPLNAILGLSEALQEEVYGELNEKQLGSLHSIEESGHHLLALINDVLDVSKIEAGKLELVIETTYVNDVCRASLGLIKQTARKKRIQVISNLDNEVSMIQADARRLKQILVNLLSNAVKFTPDGGSIGLEVVGDAEKQIVRFIVWDTGIGIAPEDMEYLFKPFVQLDSSLSRRYAGTGLGLVLVQRLTDMHGGSVTVESEVGKGSRFTVSLPWQPAEAKPVSAEISPERPKAVQVTTGAVVLLAEDTESNIDVVSRYLRGRGYRVIVARNGSEAILRIWEERPDVILMDVQMPEMDGLDATRCIRADVNLANIPIIAMTALAMPGDLERCLAAGANDYISKPVSLRRLVEMIETQLRRNTHDDGGYVEAE